MTNARGTAGEKGESRANGRYRWRMGDEQTLPGEGAPDALAAKREAFTDLKARYMTATEAKWGDQPSTS